MGESAVMAQAKTRASELGDDIQVRRFGGQTHGGGGQSCLAIESCASEASAEQKVRDGFQAF
jgi:hypothetical protein